MITFFAIVAFLVFQVGVCSLCIYLSNARRHKKMLQRGGLFSAF